MMSEKERYSQYIRLLMDITKQDKEPDLITSANWIRLLKNPIDQILGVLMPLTRDSIRLRYGLDTGHFSTYLEVGDHLHRTGSRIQQIVTKTLRRLSYPQYSHHLWLLYMIDCSLVPSKDPQRRALGLHDVKKTSVNPTEEDLLVSAKEVIIYYRFFRSEEQDTLQRELYDTYHRTHDHYIDNRWKERKRKKR